MFTCLKRLSTRLLLLTAIWVSFISSMVGYTMWLNWELEASAASTQAIANIRYHVYRAEQFTQSKYPDVEFDNEIRLINEEMRQLREGDLWRPLSIPKTSPILALFGQVEKHWQSSMEPDLINARKTKTMLPMRQINSFTEDLSGVNDLIESHRVDYRWQLRYIQILLIVLAMGSLAAIMYLLVSWVINPLGKLGQAIQRLSAGDLNFRIREPGHDEIGEIAVGLNHMAERLKDLYMNLEQKVAEKNSECRRKEFAFGTALRDDFVLGPATQSR